MHRVRVGFIILVILLAPLSTVHASGPGPQSGPYRSYLPLALGPGTPSPLPGAVIAATLNTIRTRFEAMPNPDYTAARLELAGTIRALPHIADAGVAADDAAVWAYFTDGRMLTIPVTVPHPAAAAQTTPEQTGRPATSPDQELPAGNTAYLLDALGSCFNHALTDVTPWMTANQYTVAPIQPTVDQLKTVHDAAFFYVDTHGGAVQGLAGPNYAMWTLDPWSLASDVTFLDDILGGRLVYMLAKHDVDTSGQNCTSEWHYAITGAFVAQYMTFTPRSFVFFNGCSSMSVAAQPMRSAFASKGASRYLGWTAPVDDYDSYLIGLTIFDLMLAANTLLAVTPPLRPFDFDIIFQTIRNDGYDDSSYVCGAAGLRCRSWLRAEAFSADPAQRFNLLRPTITRVNTRLGTYGTTEPPMVLHLHGLFGSERGQVTVGGQEVAVHTWKPTYILAALPGHGPGSAGDVVVSVHNHRSNPAPLSEWRGHVHWRVDYNTYLVPAEGLVAEVDCQFQLRADYHAYRPEPADDAQNADAEVVGGQDSRCTWQMSGDVTWTSLGDVYRGVLTGSGEVAWRDGQGPPGPLVSPGGMIQPAQHTMLLGAGVGGVYGDLAIYRNGVYQRTDQVELLDMGIMPASLTANGSILTGTGTYDWLFGRSTAHWDTIPVHFPPTAATPG
jgi:hypothetical protein